jgi:hypothetical protein
LGGKPDLRKGAQSLPGEQATTIARQAAIEGISLDHKIVSPPVFNKFQCFVAANPLSRSPGGPDKSDDLHD